MNRDEVIALARQAGLFIPEAGIPENGALMRFAALVEAHLKAQGYRQCAKGQKTSQFCGMLEQAVHAERETCAQIAKQWDIDHPSTNYGGCIANLIQSRGT